MLKNEWEYCQINFRIMDDGRAATSGAGLATRLMWIQFLAEANEFGRSYVAGKSERLPVTNMAPDGLTPQKGNIGQQNILAGLVQSLKNDGWELLPTGNGEWWERNFRRPTSIEKVKKSKVKRRDRLLIVGALIALAIIGYLVFSLFSSSDMALREFASAELTTLNSSANATAGRMVVINRETSELDPIHQSLPENMTAEASENFDGAETIVWIDCARESTWKGATVDCQVTVIDWEQKAIWAQETFESEFMLFPTDAESGEKQELSDELLRDSDSIRDFLTSLPKS